MQNNDWQIMQQTAIAPKNELLLIISSLHSKGFSGQTERPTRFGVWFYQSGFFAEY